MCKHGRILARLAARFAPARLAGRQGPLCAVILGLVWAGNLHAGGPDSVWTRTYGGTAADYGYCVRQTPADGGYVIAGTTYSFGAGSYDAYLVKTDDQGDSLWMRTYGGPGAEYAYSVEPTLDGGYILAGYTSSSGSGGNDFYLVKTDQYGNAAWEETYGGGGDDRARAVRQTLPDSGYIIAGYTASFGLGAESMYLVKTDASGIVAWTRTYGGPDWDEATDVEQTPDGGYIVVGSTASFGSGMDEVYLIKTEPDGDSVWTRTIGAAGSDYGYSVDVTRPDSGFIVAGATYSFGAGSQVYLARTTAHGDTLWTKSFGGASNDYGYSVRQTFPDSGFIVTGSTRSYGVGGDVYIVKTDRRGDLIWTRNYGGSVYDEGMAVVQTVPDSGYVVVGSTRSFGSGNYDVYLLKSEPVLAGIDDADLVACPAVFVRISPNPFTDGTLIQFDAPWDRPVPVRIYNLLGQEMAHFAAARSPLYWDGTAGPGRKAAPGLYFIRVGQAGRSATAKALLMR